MKIETSDENCLFNVINAYELKQNSEFSAAQRYSKIKYSYPCDRSIAGFFLLCFLLIALCRRKIPQARVHNFMDISPANEQLSVL